jgi:peptide deformylase
MLKIRNDLVQDGELHDDYLHRRLFPVNIRLYQNNGHYYAMIHSIVGYMKRILETKYDDYTSLKGISGANIGVPFNIIVVKNASDYLVMLNPSIDYAKGNQQVSSNCGSLVLPKPIPVMRAEDIVVSYCNLEGRIRTFNTSNKQLSATLQHEILHNMGKLITDAS